MGLAEIRDDVHQELKEEILPNPNLTIKEVVTELCRMYLDDEVDL